jgi:hypothetical protein
VILLTTLVIKRKKLEKSFVAVALKNEFLQLLEIQKDNFDSKKR